MRKKIPASAIAPGHPDYVLLKSISDEIDRKAGGRAVLASEVPLMLRDCIDALINTPRTGRRDFNELEKVEKTFIGTHVEIVVRRFLRLEKGLLDTVILGHDVDIKFTTGDNWTIPPEAYNHPCLIIAADEERSLCYMGLIVIRPEVMHGGAGRRRCWHHARRRCDDRRGRGGGYARHRCRGVDGREGSSRSLAGRRIGLGLLY